MSVSLSAGAFCRPGRPLKRRMGGREGRERPDLPRIWVGAGPASRVAHAPCHRPDRPDKRGPDRVQFRTRLRAQIQITIAPAIVRAIELPNVVRYAHELMVVLR